MADIGGDLAEAGRLYMRLAAQVQLERKPGARKLPWKSKIPMNIDVVDHMVQLEQFILGWIKGAKWLLDPWSRVDITDRTKNPCPYCGGKLVGWLHSGTETSYVLCDSEEPHADGEPKKWLEDDWRRLGVLADSNQDA